MYKITSKLVLQAMLVLWHLDYVKPIQNDTTTMLSYLKH